MYIYKKAQQTTLKVNQSYRGERLEQKINRIVNNNEPIEDTSPPIYTERKDGVLPAYDIRTDRWDIAIDAMDKVDKMHQAKRMENLKEKETKTKSEDTTTIEGETGGQSTQGTGESKKA